MIEHEILRALDSGEITIYVNGEILMRTRDPALASLYIYVCGIRGVLTGDVAVRERLSAMGDIRDTAKYGRGAAFPEDWIHAQIKKMLQEPLPDPGSPTPHVSPSDMVGDAPDPNPAPVVVNLGVSLDDIDPPDIPVKKPRGKKGAAQDSEGGKPGAKAALPAPAPELAASTLPSTCSWKSDPILGRPSGGGIAIAEIYIPRGDGFRDPRAAKSWCSDRGYTPVAVRYVVHNDIPYWRVLMLHERAIPPAARDTVSLAHNFKAVVLRTGATPLPPAMGYTDPMSIEVGL